MYNNFNFLWTPVGNQLINQLSWVIMRTYMYLSHCAPRGVANGGGGMRHHPTCQDLLVKLHCCQEKMRKGGAEKEEGKGKKKKEKKGKKGREEKKEREKRKRGRRGKKEKEKEKKRKKRSKGKKEEKREKGNKRNLEGRAERERGGKSLRGEGLGVGERGGVGCRHVEGAKKIRIDNYVLCQVNCVGILAQSSCTILMQKFEVGRPAIFFPLLYEL